MTLDDLYSHYAKYAPICTLWSANLTLLELIVIVWELVKSDKLQHSAAAI